MRGRRRLRVPVPPPDTNRARVNDQIRVASVRLIDNEGEQRGVVTIDEARRAASDADLIWLKLPPPPVHRFAGSWTMASFSLSSRRRIVRKRNVRPLPSEGNPPPSWHGYG